MEGKAFREKYLGELTFKDGRTAMFKYPITNKDIALVPDQAKQDYHDIMNNYGTSFVKEDNLTMQQYLGVMAGQMLYGVRYWTRDTRYQQHRQELYSKLFDNLYKNESVEEENNKSNQELIDRLDRLEYFVLNK